MNQKESKENQSWSLRSPRQHLELPLRHSNAHSSYVVPDQRPGWKRFCTRSSERHINERFHFCTRSTASASQFLLFPWAGNSVKLSVKQFRQFMGSLAIEFAMYKGIQGPSRTKVTRFWDIYVTTWYQIHSIQRLHSTVLSPRICKCVFVWQLQTEVGI